MSSHVFYELNSEQLCIFMLHILFYIVLLVESCPLENHDVIKKIELNGKYILNIIIGSYVQMYAVTIIITIKVLC